MTNEFGRKITEKKYAVKKWIESRNPKRRKIWWSHTIRRRRGRR
jgi:hypothetical protein